jgi:cytochrome c-type biogenesis protein CcmE
MSRSLLSGTVLLGAGILTLVFNWSEPGPVYARSVSQFLMNPVRERTVRVTGMLVPGSLSRSSRACEYDFRLADSRTTLSEAGTHTSSQELSVHYPACAIPDNLRDVPGLELELSVEGELCASCHRFEATQVMAKCPGTYRVDTDGGAQRAAVPACLLK